MLFGIWAVGFALEIVGLALDHASPIIFLAGLVLMLFAAITYRLRRIGAFTKRIGQVEVEKRIARPWER
jgi:hypothetical protein